MDVRCGQLGVDIVVLVRGGHDVEMTSRLGCCELSQGGPAKCSEFVWLLRATQTVAADPVMAARVQSTTHEYVHCIGGPPPQHDEIIVGLRHRLCLLTSLRLSSSPSAPALSFYLSILHTTQHLE